MARFAQTEDNVMRHYIAYKIYVAFPLHSIGMEQLVYQVRYLKSSVTVT